MTKIGIIIVNLIIVFTVMVTTAFEPNTYEVSGNNKSEGESNFIVYESKINDHNIETSSANASDLDLIIESLKAEVEIPTIIIPVEVPFIAPKYSRNLSEEDKYLLAKIAMAEAEGESIETKIFVILTILNRVESSAFPNTIEEVIFQSDNGIYQFSPIMPGGRWWNIEPNEECWEAIKIVNEMEYDKSNGALYFESCTGESWHSKNLEFICQSDNMRFYK